MAYEVALGWSRNARASCASCFSPATPDGAAATLFFAALAALLFLAEGDAVVGGLLARLVCVCARTGDAAALTRSINVIEIAKLEMARKRKQEPSPTAVFALVTQDWRGVRIRTQRFGIAARQDLHHPVIEIIHWMILYSLEAAIVFFVSLFN